MRVYIAGPMTGHEAYNFEAFMRATISWARAGHDCHTPFEVNRGVWERHFGRPFDPFVDKCEYGDPILREMFAGDVELLLKCDALVLLPGWEHSRGGRIEVQIAYLFNMPIYDAETMERIPVSVTVDGSHFTVQRDAAEPDPSPEPSNG